MNCFKEKQSRNKLHLHEWKVEHGIRVLEASKTPMCICGAERKSLGGEIFST